MSNEQTPGGPTLAEQLQQLLAAQTHQMQTAAPQAPMVMMAPQMMQQPQQPFGVQQMMPAGQVAAQVAPRAVLFRVSIPLPDGSEVGGYLQFDVQPGMPPQALQMLAMQAVQMWGVQPQQPRRFGGGWNGSYRSNGYNGHNGGFGRRY